MSTDGTLFGDGDPGNCASVEQPNVSDSIADWQLRQLRSALDKLGLTTMHERQAVIERLVGRHVEALAALEPREARLVLEQLNAQSRSANGPGTRSAWDDRDEDTWIDRL